MNENMNDYVLGFLFNHYGEVWLIRKMKPDWQKGKLNGIGGKIEPNETAAAAMEREFREEAELTITDWNWYATITDDKNYKVYCYYTYCDKIPTSMTDEKVILCYTRSLPLDVIPNVNWLIPMALSFKKGEHADRFLIKEMYKVD